MSLDRDVPSSVIHLILMATFKVLINYEFYNLASIPNSCVSLSVSPVYDMVLYYLLRVSFGTKLCLVLWNLTKLIQSGLISTSFERKNLHQKPFNLS